MKYKDQIPKTFGKNHSERCYPVSAVISMLEEQAKQLRQDAVIKSACVNCGKPKEEHSKASELCPTRFAHFKQAV